MPELPEVETTCRGIAPHIQHKHVTDVIIRQSGLRWPVPNDLKQQLIGHPVNEISRRGKYLLLHFVNGTVIIHLGMSGNLRIVTPDQPVKKHDHVDIVFTDNTILRFNDPRRFGCVLWTEQPVEQHSLLSKLGPEPLSDNFNVEYLHQQAKGKKTAVKSLLMDSHVVVGVGNIYANEALFMAGIHPTRAAGRISLTRYKVLTDKIKIVLRQAIEQGGTTLKDFVNEAGKPGYFQQQLNVYGRVNQPCINCQQTLKEIRLNNRSTVYCPHCQH